MKKQKICIIGDGLTGLTAAMALSELNIETHLVINSKKNSKILDKRTTAVSPSNFQFLTKLLKKNSSKFFWPSSRIDLYYEQDDKYLHFMNFENQGKNLMYVIENHILKKILLKKLKNQKNLKIISEPASKIDEKKSVVFFKQKMISYDLIILCVGKKSRLTEKLVGKRFIENNYNEIAFTTIVKHKSKIDGSKQYFLNEGPLAILPINQNQFSLIWSVSKKYNLNNINYLIKEKLKKILKFEKKYEISEIDFFPISFKLNINFSRKNVLILGEGSYNIHPVAGQGFNLILRDIKKLYEEIDKYLNLGLQLKDSSIFSKYTSYRKPENLIFGLGINFVNRFFKYDKITYQAKKILLKDIDKLKFLKDLNLKISDTGIFK